MTDDLGRTYVFSPPARRHGLKLDDQDGLEHGHEPEGRRHAAALPRG
jgi:hypothetical protein